MILIKAAKTPISSLQRGLLPIPTVHLLNQSAFFLPWHSHLSHREKTDKEMKPSLNPGGSSNVPSNFNLCKCLFNMYVYVLSSCTQYSFLTFNLVSLFLKYQIYLIFSFRIFLRKNALNHKVIYPTILWVWTEDKVKIESCAMWKIVSAAAMAFVMHNIQSLEVMFPLGVE